MQVNKFESRKVLYKSVKIRLYLKIDTQFKTFSLPQYLLPLDKTRLKNPENRSKTSRRPKKLDQTRQNQSKPGKKPLQ